jgi:hypothetical protein
LYPSWRVFENDAIRGIHAEHIGNFKKNFGVRFRIPHLMAIHDRLEIPPQTRPFED